MLPDPKRTIFFGDLDEIRRVDDHTLEFSFKKPKQNLLEILSDVSFLIVARGSYDAEIPVGSGPYRVKSYQPGKKLLLGSFGRYWKGVPRITEIQVVFFSNRKKMLLQLKAGKGDLVFAKSSDELLEFSPSMGFRVFDFPSLTTYFLAFNSAIAPFDNANVRRAFQYLLDFETVVKEGLQRFGQNAFSLLTPEIQGYRGCFRKVFDLAAARELLARAGYARGLSTKIFYNQNNPGTNSFVSALIRNGRKIGVNIAPHGVSFSEMMKILHETGTAPLFISGFGKTVDPEIFLAMLESGGFFNNGNYSSFEYDAILEQLRSSDSREKKLALVREAQEIICRDTPLIPIYHSRLIYVGNRSVRKVVLNPIGVLDFFRCELN
jgi:dipeptide transport system substrate-binding protein